MLEATTDYVTWVDADACFKGNCSNLLRPPAADQIHIRMREAAKIAWFMARKQSLHIFSTHGNKTFRPKRVLRQSQLLVHPVIFLYHVVSKRS